MDKDLLLIKDVPVETEDTPEWEATCHEYFDKIYLEPLRHFNVDSYSDLVTGAVTNEIQAHAVSGDNEAYFDDREVFNIFEADS